MVWLSLALSAVSPGCESWPGVPEQAWLSWLGLKPSQSGDNTAASASGAMGARGVGARVVVVRTQGGGCGSVHGRCGYILQGTGFGSLLVLGCPWLALSVPGMA